MFKQKVCKKIINSKWFKKLDKYYNKKIDKEWSNYCFLQELCVENGKLNLNKYYRLLNMVKRKYKK